MNRSNELLFKNIGNSKFTTHVCRICKSSKTIEEDFFHSILKSSLKIQCLNCYHIEIKNDEINDEIFSSEYQKINFHLEKNKPTFNRKLFIELSRIALIYQYLKIKNDINILEVGPGYPGLYHYFKKSNFKFNYFISEKNKYCVEEFQKLGVKNIDNDFTSNCNLDIKFDLIICNNVFYYFQYPDQILKNLLNILNKNSIIFIDILNSKILDDNYLTRNDFTLRHIFSKNSIKHLINVNECKILFIGTNSRKIPLTTPINTIKKKILNRLGLLNIEQFIEYFMYSDEFNYQNEKGQYLRTVIQKL